MGQISSPSSTTFGLPLTYQEILGTGSPGAAHRELSLPDVEWLTDGSDGLDMREYWRAGFIPFALNGRGDAWCFCPPSNNENHPSPVALCCHDFPIAQLYAPSFSGWIFRRILEICLGDYGLEELRLELWTSVLGPLMPRPWVQTLNALKLRPPVPTLEKGRLRLSVISDSEYQALVERHLHMSGLDQIFEWRKQQPQAS